MSSECAPPESRESARRERATCRVPNCWRDGHVVRIAGETVRETVLCDKHEKTFIRGSS
jgi:hypothetical protein